MSDDAIAKIDAEAQAKVDEAHALTITEDAHMETAGAFVRGLKAIQNKINSTFDPIIKKQRDALEEARDQKKSHSQPLKIAETIVKGKMAGFHEAQEAIRAEEERKMREEARRREEEERLAQAAALEKEGRPDEAEQVLDDPVEVPAIKPPPAKKVEGISYRTTWKAEVVSFKLLVEYVAKNPKHLNLLKANTTAINQLARALKANMEIPGIRVTSEKTVAARS